jgi:hypothetical protein
LRFTVEIDCDGDAFQPNPTEELYTILTNIRNHMYEGAVEGIFLDINGNTVGKYQLTES